MIVSQCWHELTEGPAQRHGNLILLLFYVLLHVGAEELPEKVRKRIEYRSFEPSRTVDNIMSMSGR